MVSQNKQSAVQVLTEQLQNSTNFVLVKFDKTKHQTLETLRKTLKKEESNLKIIKNTLFEKAINKLSIKDKQLAELKKRFFPIKETTALLVFNGEWSKGLTSFFDFIQKEKTLSFKFGMLDNQSYDEALLTKIAKLPSKPQLMAKIIGSIKSPMSKMTYAMKYNTQKFVYILKEKSKST